MKRFLIILTGVLIILGTLSAQAQRRDNRSDRGLEGWDKCAIENSICQVSPGTYDMAYGANGAYVYKNNAYLNGDFPCRTSTFNDQDPISGVTKYCYIKRVQGGGWRQNNGPRGMNYCATENSICQVRPGYYDIAYGANRSYIYKNSVYINGSFPCRTRTFNDQDPISGVTKYCYVSPLRDQRRP